EDLLKTREGAQNGHYSVTAAQPMLTETFNNIQEFKFLLQQALKRPSEDLLQEIKISRIRGRGGAGFHMGIKWEGCRNEISDDKFIICIADEGEPGAFSDRYLLEERPLSVLFGMLVAGLCTGANWGVLIIRAEYPEAVHIIEEKIREHYGNSL